jgi:hypothetical protein
VQVSMTLTKHRAIDVDERVTMRDVVDEDLPFCNELWEGASAIMLFKSVPLNLRGFHAKLNGYDSTHASRA